MSGISVKERARRTVLLIDDELSGLRLRERVLQSAGFRALIATNGDDAMELFRMNDVDLVVTDHLLGRTTAAGIVAAMKRLKPHIPVVSLSGTTNFEETLTYADHFIGKGEGPEVLINTLDQLLEQVPVDEDESGIPVDEKAKAIPPAALLSAIVEDSSDAILSKTLNGIITSWNHSAELMYGYKREEVIGRSVTILLPPDRPNEINHILSRLKRGERIYHFETVRVTKNGHYLNVALTISPIRDAQGRLVGASTIARDITDQKRAQDALQKAEKLALAGRMAATIAHEINNPLEAIGNILYLLRNVVEMSEEARRYVEIAYDELKRVSEIAKLTLGMQRGASDSRESVQVTKLLDNVLTLYQGRTKTLGIELSRKYLYHGNVIGSPGELRQVFSNLIVNAMDALATKGNKLSVSVRFTHRWDTGEPGIRVNVCDNGPGISPEHRSQLFQAFYTTKGEQGTGIGLWVSRAIVQKHSGRMGIHTSVTPGRSGTCFSVFLPLERVAQIPKTA